MTPRHAAPDHDDTDELELAVTAMMRDTDLDLLGHVDVRFIYEPSDPYALHIRISTPFERGTKEWTVSREVFCVAALWGIGLPGLDFTVTPVEVTRARPGRPTREVPCLRATLREFVEDRNGLHHFTGVAIHLDITTSDVRDWFAMLTRVVPIGQEHEHIDIDTTIAELLGPSFQEGS